MNRPYYTFFNLLALSLVVYIGVDVFYTYVGEILRPVNRKKVTMPLQPEVKRHQRPSLADYGLIIEKDIFGTTEVKEKPVEEKKEEVAGLEPTTLNVVLLGTTGGDPQATVAVIMDPSKRKQQLYREGDKVQGALVKKILRGKVIIQVDGKDEILKMEKGKRKEKRVTKSARRRKPSPSRRPRRPISRTLRKSDIQASLEDISSVLSQVRIRPHFTGGKSDGLTLSRIKSRSLFNKLGLRNGDILRGVDGSAINKPDDLMTLYEKLKSGSRVSLDITRRGQQKTINYRLR